jgi:uncharacterized protein (TIRG00374 family)
MTSARLSGRKRSRLFAVTLWFGLTAALIVALRALPWQNTLQRMARTDPSWSAVAVAANIGILAVWAAEWRLLAPSAFGVLYSAMFEIVATMAAVLNSIPFFAGEATGVALLVDRAGLARGAALSVLAMDQLLSGIGKLTVLGLVAVTIPLPSWLKTGVVTLVGGVVALLVVLLAVAHGWEGMRARLAARVSTPRRVLARIVSVGAHLEALRQTHRVWRIMLLALAKKVIELTAIVAVQLALGVEPSFGTALLVLASIAVATLAPIAPANIGVYEAAVFAAYRFSGVPAETALALAVVQHICFLVPMLTTGYVILTVRQVALRRRTS